MTMAGWQGRLLRAQQREAYQRVVWRNTFLQLREACSEVQQLAKQRRAMLATATAADRRTRKRQAYLSWRKRTRAAARVALAEHVQLRRCLRRAIHAWRNRPARRRFVGLMDVRTEIALLLESASSMASPRDLLERL